MLMQVSLQLCYAIAYLVSASTTSKKKVLNLLVEGHQSTRGREEIERNRERNGESQEKLIFLFRL